MKEEREGGRKRERVAAGKGFYRDYIKPAIYLGGFAPNSHSNVHGKGGVSQCQGEGHTPSCFLVFSSVIKVQPRLRQITTCGLEVKGAHTTHIHIQVLLSHISHKCKLKHATILHRSAQGSMWRAQLTHEYINRLMLQIYVPINGVLERGRDITNTSASWQRPSTRLHSWHLYFFLSSSLFLCPIFTLQKSPFIMLRHILNSASKRYCFPLRLASCYCYSVCVCQGMSSGQQTVISCRCYVPYTVQ